MKKVAKTKKQLLNDISFLRKQIKTLGKLQPKLNHKKKELKQLVESLEDRVECRTSAERVVHRQLHSEIEQRKQAEQAIQDALEYADCIINTVREPLVVLDADLRVISASRSFYRVFKVKSSRTERQHIYDLGDRQWDIPKLRELLEDILPKASSFDDFIVEHDFPSIGKRIMLLNAREIIQKANRTKFILLAIEDITERKELEERLISLASHDDLTGCLNFRATIKFLESEIARSKRYQKEFSIIMIDIDQFKTLNDTYGHLAGNDALAAFAGIIKKNVRSIDIVGRYGGDEFLIILPETDARHALVALERMKADFEKARITSPHVDNDKEFRLRFSAGIAVFPHNAKDLKELIWVADNALRQAKRSGKNQAVLERRRLMRLNPMPGTKIEVINASGKENVPFPKIANISKEGMLFLSTQDILEEEFLCRIYCPKDKSPFELTCKVKHKGKAEGELYRIGVYFPDVPADTKEKLSQCIEPPQKTD